MNQAVSSALSLHKINDDTAPALLPTEFANCSKAMKDAYSTSLHDTVKDIFKSTENLRDVDLKNTVKQFDEKAVLVKNTADKLDMPKELADTFFAKSLEKNYSKEQLETLGDYYKEINDNPQLNNTHKNLLFDIVMDKNSPLERDKFKTAVLAKENDFVYQEVKNSQEYNTRIENDLSAMGFADNEISLIKDQITKSIYNKVHKLVFSETKATPKMLNDMAANRLEQYQQAQQEIKNYANSNPTLEKIGMRTVADLGEIPKAGYLTALHEAGKTINPAFIKEICHSGSLDRFDTALNNLAKTIFNSSNTMDKNVLPDELGIMKSNLTVHLLGECLNTLSAAERQNLADRLSSPEVTNLFSMYNNDYKNGNSVYLAQVLGFMRDQIGFMDNAERISYPRQECNYNALPLSLQNKHSLDSAISGELPKNLLKDINAAQFQERFNAVSQSMFQISFLAEMKKFAGFDTGMTVFEKDIKRSLHITLPNGVKLTNNFETTKNELASYLSHGRVNNFAELNPAEVRTAQIFMACISQEAEKVINMGASIAFNGERDEQAFITSENSEANRGLPGSGRKFRVLEDGTGGFEIQYTCDRAINLFQENRRGARPMMLDPVSREQYELNIHIPGDEIRRMQTVDFGRLAEPTPIPQVQDFFDWKEHFSVGDCNMQNVSITGGFNIYGIAEQG